MITFLFAAARLALWKDELRAALSIHVGLSLLAALTIASWLNTALGGTIAVALSLLALPIIYLLISYHLQDRELDQWLKRSRRAGP
jgi:hypothetical protein